MKAFYVTYQSHEISEEQSFSDERQVLVIAHDLTQALNAVMVEIATQDQIIGVSMVEGKVIFAADCQAPTP